MTDEKREERAERHARSEAVKKGEVWTPKVHRTGKLESAGCGSCKRAQAKFVEEAKRHEDRKREQEAKRKGDKPK